MGSGRPSTTPRGPARAWLAGLALFLLTALGPTAGTASAAPAPTNLSASDDHTCAIDARGTARCWGQGADGQTSPPADLGPVTQVSAGLFHSCAITGDQTVRCWGNNTFDQQQIPPDLGTVTAIASGQLHVCALKTNGTVRCWGNDFNNWRDPPANLGLVTQITAGGLHTCAITAMRAVRCWGADSSYQTSVPPDLGTAVQIDAGTRHTCAVTTLGTVRCWGSDPDVPEDLGTVTQIDAGDNRTCAIRPDGSARCWGSSNDALLDVPDDLGTVTRIVAGYRHGCAITTTGTTRCWGQNAHGQLGGPPTITSDPPGNAGPTPYEHRFEASSPPGLPVRFAVTAGALPPGLTLDEATGALTGTATTDGTYPATVTATNDVFGPDATQAISIDVDTTPPDAPTDLASDPASPTTEPTPTVTGRAEPASAVRLYDGDSATPIGTDVASASGAFSITATLSEGPHNLTATATDALGNGSDRSEPLTYVVDTTPPDAPTELAADPASPSASTTPTITGHAEPASTVRLYGAAGCVGPVLASGTAEELAAPGLTITVPTGATVTVHATAADAAGNVSACSAALSYAHRLPVDPSADPPATPVPGPPGTPVAGAPGTSVSGPLAARCIVRGLELVAIEPTGSGRRPRARLRGYADPEFAGRTVTVHRNGRRAGTTSVRADGTIATTVAAPRSRRARSHARYALTVDNRLRTRALKATRRLSITGQRRAAIGRTTVSGRLAGIGGRRTLTIVAQRVCGATATTRRTIRTDRRGRFRVTLQAPAPGTAPLIYRIHHGRRHFTLPIVVTGSVGGR
jgi:hypothetical protein